MRGLRSPWINVVAATVGGLALGSGLVRLVYGMSIHGAVWAVIGFLLLGWAVFDSRRFRRGTPESEVDGGHSIE